MKRPGKQDLLILAGIAAVLIYLKSKSIGAINLQKYFVKGTTINKIPFSEIEPYLEEKGFNINQVFLKMADDKEFVYVSNGFIQGLKADTNENGEWHHYFKKDDDGFFTAHKLFFN
jgi:hypothetical protein